MKKQLMTGLFTALALTAGAQTFQEWRNPEINAVNRAPMHTNYFAFENADAAKKANKKQSTNLHDPERNLEVQLGEGRGLPTH